MNATVAITIKFAPDAAVARKQLKGAALWALEWLINIALVANLLYNLLADGPVTRAIVFMIALNIGTILFVVLSKLLTRMLRIQGEMVAVSLGMQETISSHLEVTDRLADVIAKPCHRTHRQLLKNRHGVAARAA